MKKPPEIFRIIDSSTHRRYYFNPQYLLLVNLDSRMQQVDSSFSLDSLVQRLFTPLGWEIARALNSVGAGKLENAWVGNPLVTVAKDKGFSQEEIDDLVFAAVKRVFPASDVTSLVMGSGHDVIAEAKIAGRLEADRLLQSVDRLAEIFLIRDNGYRRRYYFTIRLGLVVGPTRTLQVGPGCQLNPKLFNPLGWEIAQGLNAVEAGKIEGASVSLRVVVLVKPKGSKGFNSSEFDRLIVTAVEKALPEHNRLSSIGSRRAIRRPPSQSVTVFEDGAGNSVKAYRRLQDGVPCLVLQSFKRAEDGSHIAWSEGVAIPEKEYGNLMEALLALAPGAAAGGVAILARCKT